MITPDLIPSSSYYNNVRSNVSVSDWDVIRKKCYAKANHKCEVCGMTGLEQGFKHKVECHEIWEFDDQNRTQTLTGFVSLCPMCHKVKHFGLAQLNGEEEMVLKHMMKVNDMRLMEANEIIIQAFVVWKGRSDIQWSVNIDYIDTYLIDDFNTFMKKF